MGLTDYLKQGAKAVGKGTPFGYAADFVKDAVDPNTDLSSSLSVPWNGGATTQAQTRTIDTPPQGGGAVQSAQTSTPNAGAYSEGAGDPQAAQNKAADLAYLADQEGMLRGLMGRMGTTLNQGLTTLNDDFNAKTGQANMQRGRALEDFDLQTQGVNREKENSLGRVNQNANQMNSMLRRIVGRAGGTGGTAFNEEVPDIVSRTATDDRQGVMESSGENLMKLDQSKKRADEDFASLIEDLQRQRSQREQEVREGVLAKEQEIQGSLGDMARQKAALQGGDYNAIRRASAPYQGAYNERQSQIDSLFDKFRTPLASRDVRVDTPELRNYTVDRAAVGQTPQAQQGGVDPTSPYARFLRPEDEEERLI